MIRIAVEDYLRLTKPRRKCTHLRRTFCEAFFMDSARIVVDGNSQVILLPKDYWLKGSKVYLQKVGNSLLLIPEEDAWNLLFESLHQFSDDFLTERQQPNQQERNE